MDLNVLAVRLFLIPAALMVGVIRLLRPLFLIRVGVFDSARIGHLAGNTEIYLGERELGMHPKGLLGGIDIWAHKCKPCNRQLAKMVARRLHVDPTRFFQLVYVVNMRFAGWERHIAAPDNWDRDIHDTLATTTQHLTFTEKEIWRGKKQLAAWGLKPGDKWVCLIVRDSAYLSSGFFSYHDYRDTKVRSYRRAALALADRGYHVFRMGAKVKENLDITHPMIADYATNGMRSDFMDIFLGAHCEFALTNGTGIDAIPVIFRKPICHVNGASIEYMRTWIPGLYIWKHHIKQGRKMKPKEILDCGAGLMEREEEYKAAKIQLKDNTAQEIEDAAIQMCGLDVYEPRQIEFWRQFPLGTIVNLNGKHIHGPIVRARIGSKFLEGYQ